MNTDEKQYRAECALRWRGPALRDAYDNWLDFEELKPTLLEAMRGYVRNPFMKDLAGECHLPDGTLTAHLWKLQQSLEPDRSCLLPLLDFEERYQRVFLRRGLLLYCSLLLKEINAPAATPDNQEVLVFD